MSFHRCSESSARFFALGADSAVGIERELGIDSHQFFVAQLDHRVRGFSARKTVLHRVLRAGKGIFEQALERDFTQGAEGLGTSQDAFYWLLSLRHLFPGLLH